MGLRQRVKKWWNHDKAADPTVPAGQPGTPENAIRKAVEMRKDWRVKLQCRAFGSQATIPVQDMSANDAYDLMGEGVENYLRGRGNGNWRLDVVDLEGTTKYSYKLPVGGGEKQYRPTGGKADGDGSGGGGGGGGTWKEMFMVQIEREKLQMAQAAEDRKGMQESINTLMLSQVESYKVQLEAARGSGGEGLLDNPVMMQLFTTMVNNMFVQKENFFANLKDALEFSRTLQPQITGESDTAALISSIAPLITAVVTSRGGATPQAIMPGIAQGLSSLTKEQLIALTYEPEKLRAYISTLPGGAAAAKPTVDLPQPGALMAATEAAKDKLTQPAETATSESYPAPGPGSDQAPPVPDPHLALVDSMLAQFRADITAGEPADYLARQLLGMVMYARSLPRSHRVLQGLVECEASALESEFNRFCAAVPELARDPERSLGLKLALIAALMEGGEQAPVEQAAAEDAPQSIPSEQQVIDQEEQMPGIDSEAQIRIDSEAETVAAETPEPVLKEQIDDEDRPESAGVPGGEPERTAGDASGSEQQIPEDGDQTIREDSDAAQAA